MMIDLNTFADGSLAQKFEKELQKVMDNIHDLNTSATAKRSITVKLGFKPDDKREMLNVEVNVTSTLTGHEPTTTKMLTAKQNGVAVAKELVSGAKGQMFMDVKDGQLKTDSGEPVEEEQENTNVVAFKG
ncbi:replication terminator protein [Bacillus sp. Hm123]|uniref:replication terminator protein n=1 Tax=Bacillus sp. Hm123 TaxID=3450745 RepID=UPI003F43503A